MPEYSRQQLEERVLESFIGEIDALKPGNVSRYADGHGMVYRDFVRSAEVSTPILCDPDRSVGERIRDSVVATRQVVDCNTNLGMLLLFAPIIRAYEARPIGGAPMGNLGKVLAALHKNETRMVFEAIRIASPGGLGQVEQFDVHLDVQADLLSVMGAAESYDLIAKEYVTEFNISGTIGLGFLLEYLELWNSLEWAIVGCYLSIMANYPDTHIRRKYGQDIADKTKNRAKPVLQEFKNNKNPADSVSMLLDFDKELKNSNINPGTSADLTAATLLIYRLNP